MNEPIKDNIVIVTLSSNSPTTQRIGPVSFNRLELNAILHIYGQMVAAGKCRDYAIDHLDDKAMFSIFQRTSDVPLYRIEKNPKLQNKQGAYSVVAASGMILKRGADLRQVLRVFDKALIKII